MDSKSWYASKTLWTNLSLVVGAVGAYLTGTADLNVTLMAVIPAVVNIALRLATKSPIGG